MSVFPENAVLTFQVPTGDREIDELGNPRAQLETLVVKAYLVEKRSRSQSDDASDRHELRFEGRCIDPPQLPPSLLPGTKATAVIGNLQGDFELLPTGQSPYQAVTDVLGAKLKGIFSNRVVWGQGDA